MFWWWDLQFSNCQVETINTKSGLAQAPPELPSYGLMRLVSPLH